MPSITSTGYLRDIGNGEIITTTGEPSWISLSDYSSISHIDKVRELELRVEVLENKLKQNKIEDKYKIIYGE